MALGDYSRDTELMQGWTEFCEQVRRAGERVFKDENGASEVERCSGFQYLTQNLSQAFDIWLENRRRRHPFLHPFCSPIRKLGADNADCIYYQAWINDFDSYRIYGRRGSARMFNIVLHGPWTGTLHEPFGDEPTSNVFVHELPLDEEGNFEVWVSPEAHDGNWIRTQPGSRKLFLRQYFDNWDEEPASFRIERVGPGEPPDPLSADFLLEAMRVAGKFVFEAVNDWPDTVWKWHPIGDRLNEFVPQQLDSSQKTDE